MLLSLSHTGLDIGTTPGKIKDSYFLFSPGQALCMDILASERK